MIRGARRLVYVLQKSKQHLLASPKLRVISFATTVSVVGLATLLFIRAATPTVGLEAETGAVSGNAYKMNGDVSASGSGYIRFGDAPVSHGTVSFRLFAPGWRPMAEGKNEAIAKASIFKEIIDGTYYEPSEPDPSKRNKALDPADLQARGAKVYNYTLGPYVTNRYVPCDLIPNTHPDYNDYVVDTPTCLDETGARARPDDLNFPGFSFSEWRKVIAQAKYNDPTNPKSPQCNTDPLGATTLSVYACRFENNFLIYPNSLPWIRYLQEELTPDALKFGSNSLAYDGVFADSVGSNPADDPAGYLNHVPLKPASTNSIPVITDPKYDRSSWLSASAESLVARKNKLDTLSGKLLTLNGLESGMDYWEGCSLALVVAGNCSISGESNRKLLVSGLHGAMSESIFRAAGAGINAWGSIEKWHKDIEMIRDVQARGIKGYWWVKCWTGTDYSCDDENQATVVQWRRFLIASYLLGAGDKSYFNYDTKRDDRNSAQYFEDDPTFGSSDYDHASALGSTTNTNKYSQIGTSSVYTRCFSKGLVLVNPTGGSITVTIPTPGNYKKFGATTEINVSSITLPAHTGELLVKSTSQSCN